MFPDKTLLIFKIDNKWYKATVIGGKLKQKRQIKKLSDAKNENTITLNKYLKSVKDASVSDIVKDLQSVYINLPDNTISSGNNTTKKSKTKKTSERAKVKTSDDGKKSESVDKNDNDTFVDSDDIVTDTFDRKEFEKQYWQSYNEMCLGCKKKCKQSSKVDIINCYQYEER